MERKSDGHCIHRYQQNEQSPLMLTEQFNQTLLSLYEIFTTKDASLIEINPLKPRTIDHAANGAI
jgi:succinyl-CoA synthetase beta subunit